MADTKITGLPTLTSVADGDYVEIVDVSATPPTGGTNKKITRANLLSGVYVAGGTDVPIADGGTNASTAANARSNLGVPSTSEAINPTIVDAKGDLIVGSAADTVVRKAAAVVDGKYLMADSTQSDGLLYQHPMAIDTHANRLSGGHSGTRLFKESDTGVTYLDALGSWSIWNAVGFVGKTADETVTSNATVQDDDALLFPVEASEVWAFEGVLLVSSANATMDFKHTIAGPTSPSAAGWWRRPIDPTQPAVGGTPTTVTAFATTTSQGSAASALSIFVIEFAGWIVNGANAGNVKVQWSQDTSNVSNLKVLKGSYLVPKRLA